MNLRQLPIQLEISFWSFFISIFSDSSDLQLLLQRINDMKKSMMEQILLRTLVWLGAGLLVGLTIGLIWGLFSA